MKTTRFTRRMMLLGAVCLASCMLFSSCGFWTGTIGVGPNGPTYGGSVTFGGPIGNPGPGPGGPGPGPGGPGGPGFGPNPSE